MTLRFLQEEPIEAIIKNIDRIHTWVILSPSYLLFIIFFFTQGAEADPRDIEGQTPLFLAASVGGTETVQLLMDRGADITLKDMELRSALHVAIGNTSTMDALMKVPTSQHY